MQAKIPRTVRDILFALEAAGFEAFVVGGSVRDLTLGRTPRDWDITTNALPEQIQTLFPDSFYENAFGTVGVKVAPFSESFLTSDEARKGAVEKEIIEVTTYRLESGYSDHRRPDAVAFTDSLENDLARRDFTINALALSLDGTITDPFGGQQDLRSQCLRTVGDPAERFTEDALRLVRAIRLWAELRTPASLTSADPVYDTNTPATSARDTRNWHIDPGTFAALRELAPTLAVVSGERLQDELLKIIASPSPAEGIDLLRRAGLLSNILPELEESVGIEQNLHHVFTVYEHNLRALKTCPSIKPEVRMAALLHDVAKPRTKQGNGYRSTFYNHDHVGARLTDTMLRRLHFPAAFIHKVSLLVDNHLFYYNVGEVTEASVRRLIKKVGLENMPDLMDVRIADRLGSGVPKAKPYRLRHLEYLIDKVSLDAISVKMLKVGGNDLIESLGIAPGPMIGAILDVLLAEVIEDPTKNDHDPLLIRAHELSRENLSRLRKLAQETIDDQRAADDQIIKRKHHVE